MNSPRGWQIAHTFRSIVVRQIHSPVEMEFAKQPQYTDADDKISDLKIYICVVAKLMIYKWENKLF